MSQGFRSRLSVRTRLFTLGAIWLTGGFLLLILALEVHPVFWIAFGMVFVCVGRAGIRLSCARCGYPVARLRPGLAMSPWAGWLPPMRPAHQIRLASVKLRHYAGFVA
jgi:hypothetical protein